jgi:hypothetical protein
VSEFESGTPGSRLEQNLASLKFLVLKRKTTDDQLELGSLGFDFDFFGESLD